MTDTSQTLEEWLSTTAYGRYLEAKDLSDRQSLTDDPERPYESKYKAKEIIAELVDQLSQRVVTAGAAATDGNDMNVSDLVRVVLHYEFGCIDLDTEDTPEADKHFKICLNLINDMVSNARCDPNRMRFALTLFTIVANNQLAYIWCSRHDYEKAVPHLKEAENTYHYWCRSDDQSMHLLLDFRDVFTAQPLTDQSVSRRANDPDNKGVENLEAGHTLTLYLLAQTFEKMGDSSESAVYCHQTLKRQYKHIGDRSNITGSNGTELYDRLDWALNAATLSQYFSVQTDFHASRHFICCALKVINSCPAAEDESEKYRKCMADLKRIIVKYCLMLLEVSGATIRDQQQSATDTDGQQLAIEPTAPVDADTFRPYLLNDREVEELEKTIRTFPIKTLTEAQQVFKYGNQCLSEAMDFYTLDERASDNIECIQDRSKLYQYLIPFDTDYERQCRMHKRRIDALEALRLQVSPKHFMGQYRQLLFELAEIYTQMAELKVHLMDDKPIEGQLPAAKKVNQLLIKAFNNYEEFRKTFIDPKSSSTNKLPDKLPEDYVRPVLLALFSCGRLNSKLLTMDPREQLNNWQICEDYYKLVRDYLERNPDHKQHFLDEWPLLDEMLQLIPGKMKMILNSTIY